MFELSVEMQLDTNLKRYYIERRQPVLLQEDDSEDDVLQTFILALKFCKFEIQSGFLKF
jgi:hypothetical protein